MKDFDWSRNWSCSLSESAAIWEPIAYRTLQSWTSGQTLKIKASGARHRYGLLSQLQFGLASRLLKTGLPKRGIQVFLDKLLDPDFFTAGPAYSLAEKMAGRFIFYEDPEDADHVVALFFKDEEKFWLAVKLLTEQTPPHFVTIDLGDVWREVLDRIMAWNQRREYDTRKHGEQIKKALLEIRELNLEQGLPVNAPTISRKN